MHWRAWGPLQGCLSAAQASQGGRGSTKSPTCLACSSLSGILEGGSQASRHTHEAAEEDALERGLPFKLSSRKPRLVLEQPRLLGYLRPSSLQWPQPPAPASSLPLFPGSWIIPRLRLCPPPTAVTNRSLLSLSAAEPARQLQGPKGIVKSPCARGQDKSGCPLGVMSPWYCTKQGAPGTQMVVPFA